MSGISLTTSSGMWPTHLVSASRLTGFMIWSDDLSTLHSKNTIDFSPRPLLHFRVLHLSFQQRSRLLLNPNFSSNQLCTYVYAYLLNGTPPGLLMNSSWCITDSFQGTSKNLRIFFIHSRGCSTSCSYGTIKHLSEPISLHWPYIIDIAWFHLINDCRYEDRSNPVIVTWKTNRSLYSYSYVEQPSICIVIRKGIYVLCLVRNDKVIFDQLRIKSTIHSITRLRRVAFGFAWFYMLPLHLVSIHSVLHKRNT